MKDENSAFDPLVDGFVMNERGELEDELPAVVMDVSYLVSALLCEFSPNESESPRAFIQNLLSKNGQIVVPQLFWFEVGNVLLNASRPKKNGFPARISLVQLDSITYLLGDLPIYTDSQPNAEIRSRIMRMAQEEGLSYYDASYLELARRKCLSLKTLDLELLAASGKV